METKPPIPAIVRYSLRSHKRIMPFASLVFGGVLWWVCSQFPHAV